MPFGAASRHYVDEIESLGGVFLSANSDEVVMLNALYDTLVAVEEHDLSVSAHEIDKRQFIQSIKSAGIFGKIQLFRYAGRLSPCVERATRLAPAPIPEPATAESNANGAPPVAHNQTVNTIRSTAPLRPPRLSVDVLIGDTELDSS